MTARRKPGEPRGRTPMLLPAGAGQVWTRFVDELRDCLRDPARDAGLLYQRAEAAREQAQWPCETLGDEYLIGGLLRLCFAYSMAPGARRGWMRAGLGDLHDVVEGMVDRAASPTPEDRAAREAAVAASPAAPQPGQPGYRADIDG